MAEENEDPPSERALGRLEGALAEISRSLGEMRTESADNWGRQWRTNAGVAADLKSLSNVVERIRKPVDMLISSRNVLVGLLSLLGAVGAVWGYFAGLPGWIYGLFAIRQ